MLLHGIGINQAQELSSLIITQSSPIWIPFLFFTLFRAKPNLE